MAQFWKSCHFERWVAYYHAFWEVWQKNWLCLVYCSCSHGLGLLADYNLTLSGKIDVSVVTTLTNSAVGGTYMDFNRVLLLSSCYVWNVLGVKKIYSIANSSERKDYILFSKGTDLPFGLLDLPAASEFGQTTMSSLDKICAMHFLHYKIIDCTNIFIFNINKPGFKLFHSFFPDLTVEWCFLLINAIKQACSLYRTAVYHTEIKLHTGGLRYTT